VTRSRRFALWAALGGVALATAGCGTGGIVKGTQDKAHGKELFVAKCGACHTLADAGTLGKVGPNLDDAFRGPREEGFKESTFVNVVHGQILFPTTEPVGVITTPDGKQVRAPGMPAKLYTGQDAKDVAAYVASVAGVEPNVGATTGVTTTAPAPPPAPPATTAPTTTAATTTEATTTTGGGGNAAAGKTVFESAGCTSCHTLKDAGATGTVGPNLDQAKPSMDKVVERVTNGKGVMPSFKGQLTPQQIQDVAAYVSSVAGS
jgi:mono/diheme cytochrome c family protein